MSTLKPGQEVMCLTNNWGNPSVDWVAVGSSVYSTYKNGGYATKGEISLYN